MLRCSQWERDLDLGAERCACDDGAAASQLAGALMHGVQSDPDAMSSGNASPIISNVEVQCLSIDRKLEQAVLRIGMACGVGQGLLRNAVERHLHGGGQGWECFWDVKSYFEPLVLVVRCLFAQG